MKPSKFIPHYERMLGRPLTAIETDAVLRARHDAEGKRDTIKAMRAALVALVQDAKLPSKTIPTQPKATR